MNVKFSRLLSLSIRFGLWSSPSIFVSGSHPELFQLVAIHREVPETHRNPLHTGNHCAPALIGEL